VNLLEQPGVDEDAADRLDLLRLQLRHGVRHLVGLEHAEELQGGLETADPRPETAYRRRGHRHLHEIGEAVLFLLHRLPVAGLGGLPLADIPLRVDVAQAGDGTVRTPEIRAVHHDLMPGEQRQRMAGGLVGPDEQAEGDVVAGGVLDPREHPLPPQAQKHVGGEFDVDAHRDVIGENRQGGRRVDAAEMLLHLGGTPQGVEGGGDHDGVGTRVLRHPDMLDDPLRLGVDAPDEDGHPPLDDTHRVLDDLEPLLRGAEHPLPGGTEDEQAVDAGVDKPVEVASVGDGVEAAILVAGDDHRGDDAPERDSHDDVFLFAS